MPKSIKVSTNFTAGEISPRLLGRTDLKKYSNGVRALENFIPQVHGGIERRPGTQFVASTRFPSATTPVRLVEFQFNEEQSYILEMGVDGSDAGYIHFFRLNDDGDPIRLIKTGTSEPTLQAGAWNAAELPNLQFAQSADVLYVFCETRPIHKLSRTGTDDSLHASWTYTECAFEDGPYLPMNASEGAIITVSGTGKEGTSATLTCAESIFNYVALDGLPSQQKDVGRMIRIYDDSIGFDIKAFDSGTYTGTPSIWDPPATITVEADGSTAMLTLIDAGQQAGKRVEFLNITYGIPELNDTVYVGRNFVDAGSDTTTFSLYHPDTGEGIGFSYLLDTTLDDNQTDGIARFERAAHVGWGEITAINSSTVAVITVKKDLPTINTSQTANWRLGAWCSSQGYPKTGRFYQNRLWTASSTKEPQTIWASETGAFNCYAPTSPSSGQVTAENGITVTLADAKVNRINHLEGDTSGLIVLTSGGEWIGRASSPQAPLTPLDLGFQKNSHFGSPGNAHTIRAGTAVLFAQRDRRAIRELTYEFGQDRFNAPNITLLSEHITDSGIVDSAYQGGISNRLWYVREDGVLLSMTYEKGEEVMGWARHVLAPSKTGVAATVLSVGTTLDAGSDNVWVLVKRWVGVGAGFATATITITNHVELNGDGTAGSDGVNLVATDGNDYDFYCGDHSSVAGTWSAGISNNDTAESLMNVINTTSGPAGTRFTATRDGNVVTVTQAIAGGGGDTSITLTDSGTTGMSTTKFSGGGGSYQLYVEMIDSGLQSYEAHEHAFYVDCGAKGYNGSGATTWTGLTHLIGEDVYVLGDGVQQGPLTVNGSGEITTTSINRALIGLKYTSTMETLPLVIEDKRQEARGKLKRVYKVMANLYRTLSGKLGTPEQMYAISYPTATATALNTKMFEVSIPDNAQRESIVKFEQDTVHPANLLSIVSEFQVGQF